MRANAAWLTGGNVAYVASQGATLVVLARMGTPEVVGQFALALAVTAPISALLQLRLRDVLATDAKNVFAFRDYATLTTLLSILAVAASYLVGEAFYGPTARTVITIAALSKALESHSYIVYGLLQKQERMRRVGISSAIRGWAGFAGIFVGYAITDSLTWALLLMTAAWGAVFAFYDLRHVAEWIRAPKPAVAQSRRFRRLTLLALPLGLTSLLVTLNGSIPRLYLERYEGELELGIFGAMAYVLTALSVVVRGLSGAVAPQLAVAFASNHFTKFRRRMNQVVGATLGYWAAAMIGTLVLGEPLLRGFFGPEYANEMGVFRVIMLGSLTVFLALPLTYALIAQRRFREQVYVLVVSALVALATGPFLIGRWGMMGAAYSLLLTGAVRIVATYGIMEWTLRHAPGGIHSHEMADGAAA